MAQNWFLCQQNIAIRCVGKLAILAKKRPKMTRKQAVRANFPFEMIIFLNPS